MIARCLLIVTALVGAGPALADPRIATHFYQESEVVTIHGRADTQSTVAFDPDERIENIAVGDSAGWQVAPNKRADLLFVKPTKPGTHTNMTVVTDQRTYLFDLVSSPRAEPVYILRFTYPAPRPKPVQTAVVTPVTDVAPEVHPAPPDPATLDFAWASRGDRTLIPSRVFDDGHSTFLAWSKDVPLPAILTREASGAEGPVNYTTRGDYVVVDGVPSQLILRAGKAMATLTPSVSQNGDDDRTAPKVHKATPPIRRTPYATIVSTDR
jgi:type IV secretion system protein VirB9